MADGGDTIEWDFVTLVAWWNLYVLPMLLIVVAIVVVLRSRSRPATTSRLDGSRTVCRIGLIHFGLGLQALISLVQELLIVRTMGIPESHIRLVGVMIGAVVNALLGIGILCRRRVARRFAIAWYAILSLIAILAVAWLRYYRVAIDPASWPEQLISKVMPFFLLVVMLLPRTKRAFVKRAPSKPLLGESSNTDEALAQPPAPAGWPVASLLTVLFLIVVISNLVVDAADWGYRLVCETD
jgi:hypothetical protein